MAKQATAAKRPRRERGSINPDDIIKGAFELAERNRIRRPGFVPDEPLEVIVDA